MRRSLARVLEGLAKRLHARRAGVMQPQARLKCPAVPRRPNTLWMICSNGKVWNGDRQWLYSLTVMDLHTGYVRGTPVGAWPGDAGQTGEGVPAA